MKVVETHNIDEEYGKGSVYVTLYDNEGKRIASVVICAGEPEDNTFNRDLNGAYKIAALVKAAYEAGKRGETYEYKFIDESEGE